MIDWSKPVQTRDGRQVRIYAKDGGGETPVHGATLRPDGEWEVQTWAMDGQWMPEEPECGVDLVNAPRRVKVDGWINVYPDGATSGPWKTETTAEQVAGGRVRHACIHIEREVEEGEGLS